jgi:hypothetical protein
MLKRYGITVTDLVLFAVIILFIVVLLSSIL